MDNIVTFDFSESTEAIDTEASISGFSFFNAWIPSETNFYEEPYTVRYRDIEYYNVVLPDGTTETRSRIIIESVDLGSFLRPYSGMSFEEMHSTEVLIAYSPSEDDFFEIHGAFPESPTIEDYFPETVFPSYDSAFAAYGAYRSALWDWSMGVRESTFTHFSYTNEETGLHLKASFSEVLTIEDIRDWVRDEIITFDLSASFLRAQMLELVGTDFDDVLTASYQKDSIFGGAGNDTIRGGRGNDILDGGEDKDDKLTDDDLDVLVLEGSISAYKFVDHIERNETTVENVHTDEIDTISNFEGLKFNVAGLSGNHSTTASFVTQMAYWANHAYSSDWGDTDVSEGGHFDPWNPIGDGWKPVHAHQLGLGLRSEEENWTLTNGVFEASVAFGTGSAVAYLGEGVINGEHTLVLAFRGTDVTLVDGAFGDIVSGWGPQVVLTHFPKFKVLFSAIFEYLAENELGKQVENVYVTGHSLGGMIAQKFMDDSLATKFASQINAEFKAVTFASPGIPFGTDNDSRILHVEHSGDGVVDAGGALGYDLAGERLVMPITDKNRPEDDGPAAEHSMELYIESILALYEATDDIPSFKLFDQKRFTVGKETHAFAGREGDDNFRGDKGNIDEYLFGRGGNDIILGKGGTDQIYGGEGDDTLSGQDGHDRIFGGAGDDIIKGNWGRDRLNGGQNDDRIWGGGRKDILIGGEGADTFVFKFAYESKNSFNTRDIIKDFSKGDKIDLSKFDANGKGLGRLEFELVETLAEFKTVGTLRIVDKGSNQLVLGNVYGDKKADFAVLVKGYSDLNISDFIGVTSDLEII